jgi:hypothetical protein
MSCKLAGAAHVKGRHRSSERYFDNYTRSVRNQPNCPALASQRFCLYIE